MKRRTTLLLIAVAFITIAAFGQRPSQSENSTREASDEPSSLPGQSVTWFDTSVYLARGNGVKLGRPVFTPDPPYAENARQRKISGSVLLALAINSSGTVDMVKVIRSLEPGLDENAVNAVKQWRFTPATKDGLPVAVQVPVSVAFKLY